jgi:hypothetical protein
LLGTYQDQPAAGHKGMTIGLAGCRDRKHLGLAWALAEPFRRREPKKAMTSTPRVIHSLTD